MTDVCPRKLPLYYGTQSFQIALVWNVQGSVNLSFWSKLVSHFFTGVSKHHQQLWPVTEFSLPWLDSSSGRLEFMVSCTHGPSATVGTRELFTNALIMYSASWRNIFFFMSKCKVTTITMGITRIRPYMAMGITRIRASMRWSCDIQNYAKDKDVDMWSKYQI